MDYKELKKVVSTDNRIDILSVSEYVDGECTVEIGERAGGFYDPHAVRVEFNGIKIGYLSKDEEFKEYLFAKGGDYTVALANYHQEGDDKLWDDVKIGDLVQLTIDSGMDRVPSMANPMDEIKRIIYRDEGRLKQCESKLQLITKQPYTAEFDPIDHAYYLNGERCLSGSTFADRFKEKFNPHLVNPKTGLSILDASAKKLGLKPEEVEELWSIRGEAGRARGTMFHAYLEAYGKFINVFKNNPDLEEKILPKDDYIRNVVKSFYKGREKEQALYEVTVWTRINSIACAGEIDRLLIVDPKKKIVRVQDFKGLDLNTPIPTPSGFVKMKDLSVGDEVFDKDGKVCRVKNKSQIHNRPCFEIVFEDGAKIICDDEHRWLATIGRVGSVKQASGDQVYTAKELYTFRELFREPIIRIPVSKPLKIDDKPLPVDPYVLGLWLADGNRGAGVICNPDKRIWDEIVSRGYTIGNDISSGGKCEARTIFGLYGKLKEIGVAKNKHIPEMYMFASEEQRLDLLRGYFDGDGYWNKTRGSAVMSTTSKRQADDVYSLASSLGMKVYRTLQKGKGFGKIVNVYHLSFNPYGKQSPFLVRNINVPTKKSKENNIRYIKDIREIKSVPTQCIEVDSDTHTYLAGEAMVVTHNTNDDIKERVTLKPPFKDVLKGTALEAYRIQLDFYSAILSKVGYTVEGLDILHWDQKKKSWVTYPFSVSDITNEIKV